MISSKLDLNQKLSSKLFWVQNDFLKSRFEPKIFIKIFLIAK
jgi:hypothetical protein